MIFHLLIFGCFAVLFTSQANIFAASLYFMEDFESGYHDWTIQRGDWQLNSTESNVFEHFSKSTEGRAFRGDMSWSNYTVECEMKVTDFNKSNRALLAGRYVDGNNYYAVSLSGKDGGILELRKKVSGSSTVIAEVKTSLLEDKWYHVKLSMDGNQLRVYLDDQLMIQAEDDSLTAGAVGLVASKVIVSYDNLIVKAINDENQQPEIKPEEPEQTPQELENQPEQPEQRPQEPEQPALEFGQYSVEGFAEGVTGGGQLDENSPYYVQVRTAQELGEALRKKSSAKVIEIMNDIDLGWNMIGSAAQTSPFSKHNEPLVHPILKETGVSKLVIDGFDGLTIFSKNGSKLTHGALVVKNSKNVVIRNITFDELWEWDEATKGKYDRNDWDFITLENSSKVWIDHCTFGKAYDGIIDSKKGTNGLTISWSKFLPGQGTFYEAMFEELEANSSSYPMYKFLRDNQLNQETIMAVAAPQKKTHLIGAVEMASDNQQLEVTLQHNYYLDSQDRLPRLRGGNAHIYNIVMDSQAAYEASKLIPSSVAKAIKNKGYSFNITSNGAISTEGGAALLENSVILGIKYPLRNNQKSATNTAYTGKIEALNTIYEYETISYRGNSTDLNSPLLPQSAELIDFSWNGFSELPYLYELEDPEQLQDSLSEKTGSGILSMDWLKTTY